MKRIIVWLNLLIKKNKKMKRWQRIVTVMAAIITFVTTYALILPAITVEKQASDDVGGMYLEDAIDPVVYQDDIADEDALIPVSVQIAADKDNAVTFLYEDEEMSAVAVFASDEKIPEDAVLVVNPVDQESEMYADLGGRAAKLLALESVNEVKTCVFYDFALLCDGVDVTPKSGLADIRIYFYNNSAEHYDDVIYGGKFGLKKESEEVGAEAKENAAIEDESVDAAEMPEAKEELVGAAEIPETEEDEAAPLPENDSDIIAGDALISENSDKSSVVELSDGIITTLSIKGIDLAENDSVAGLFAGTVEKDTADAMSEDEPVVLNAGGEDYTVKVTCDAGSGVTKEASLEVSEITDKDERYQGYLEETKKAMGLSEEEQLPLFAARFFDIKIMVGGEEFVPESGVTVEIAYTEKLAEDNRMEVSALHFTEGTSEPDVIDANVTEISEDGTSNVEFTAESFSVYGVVYTVDFHWEVNGKTYKFNIPGGGYVSFEKLLQMIGVAESDGQKANSESAEEDDAEDADAEETLTLEDIQVSEATKRFAAEVNNVVFSDPELVWVGKVDEDITVGNLKEKNKLEVQYSAELTEEQIEKINAQTVKAGDWALISMKPFTSEESLTVTMKDGDVFTVRVTDAVNDAIIITNPDNTHSAQTIGNPSGTTIDLFDYWIDSNKPRYTAGRDAWPNYNGQVNSNFNPYTGGWQNGWIGLVGRGNNMGINASANDSIHGHALKFSPSHGTSVIDGSYPDGNWQTPAKDADNKERPNGGLNSWTHGATPRVIMDNSGNYVEGIVQPTLDGKYPKLTNNNSMGTNGESLAYLFDNTAHSGKQAYPGVNQLLYVDKDGYYTFDSHDFSATYVSGTNSFKLQPQTEHLSGWTEEQTGNARGFWPFGDEVFWHGMHLQTDFSMPADGKVLSPRGEYNPMEFEFQGDDDTWLYVDGILIGDGGGIHNQTLIHIDFRSGTVRVTGKKDHKDDYKTNYDQTLYLDDLYRTANPTLYNQMEWVDSPTVPGHKTFAPNSEHHFDMFYLERGGGESNLRIHYNLISTTQFSAHKSLVNSDSRLQRNQFQFELIGFDNPAYADQGELVHPVMPTNGVTTYTPNEKPPRFDSERTDLVAHTTLVTGATEDGNVNFGDIPGNISSAYIGKEYYYMLREIVPDDAVRIVDPSVQPYEYVTWEGATEEQRLEGGFVKDGITYDGKVYYYKGTVEETEPGSGKYKMVRKRYMDPNYTIPDEDTKFHNFVNGLDPLTLKVVKTKPDNDGDGEPIPGAKFSLKRAIMSEYETNSEGKITSSKWVPREGVKPYTGTTGNDGTISFPGLTEDYYILEETAAPAGYQRGETYRWLVKILKQESNGVVALVPVLVGLDADGNVIGNSTETLSVNNSTDTASYTVLNTPKEPIEISVQKEWQEADKEDIANLTGYSAEFTLKRLKSWVSTETVEGDPEPSSTLRIGRYSRDGGPWYFDNQTYTFVAGSEVTITYDYDDVHNGNWGNLRQYKIGTNGSPVTLGDNGYFNVTMPAAGQTTDVYFYDGFYQNPYWNHPDRNKFNALVSLTAVGREPQTTTTEVTTPHIDKPDNFSATVILSGENLSGTFVNPDTDDVKFPVIEVDPDTGITYTYKYYIEETRTTIPEGAGNFETIYIIDGKEMSEAEYMAHKEDDLLHDGGTQTVINRQLIDIPVEKRWPDYETHEEEGHEGEEHTYTWQAVLQIDYRDVPLDGSTPSSWREYHEDHPEYAGYSKTLTNEHLTDVFRDLPMYVMNSEGKECRREYSVVEKSYLVTDENGTVVASLEVVGDTEIVYPPGRKYTLWYQHDAGEDSNYGDEAYPDEEDYNIMVYNLHENREIVKEITADITKTWPEGFSTEDARAKFVLKRNVLVEYRNYENILNESNPNYCPRSQWVWVKLVTGDGEDQMLQVPPGRPMFIRGNIKDDGDFKKIIFTDIDGVTHIAQQDTSASFGGYKLFQVPFTAPQTSSGYTSQSNPFVIELTGGEDDAVGGINGFILSDSNDRQFIGPDQTFSREFELSDEMGWSKHFPEPAPTPEPGSETDPQDEFEHHLPSIEVSKLDEDGNTANTYIYTYYFEEVECEPESFYATFTDSTGKELLGDQDHQFYFGTNINAVNRLIGFDISKIDKDKNTKKLGGATFSIRKLKGNPPVISGQGGTIDTDPSIAFEPAETAEETGKASFSGLSPGFYEVKEDEPPTGYILTEDLVFYIKVDESGDVKLMNKAVDSDTGAVTWTEAQTGQWNGDVSYSIKNSVNGKTIVYSVRNKPGATLPHTGGSGTHIFKLLGVVLTALSGAGFMLLRKRRRYTS